MGELVTNTEAIKLSNKEDKQSIVRCTILLDSFMFEMYSLAFVVYGVIEELIANRLQNADISAIDNVEYSPDEARLVLFVLDQISENKVSMKYPSYEFMINLYRHLKNICASDQPTELTKQKPKKVSYSAISIRSTAFSRIARYGQRHTNITTDSAVNQDAEIEDPGNNTDVN